MEPTVGRDILMLGGGIGGLLTALVLANGGHSVTVLERNPEPPPTTDGEAWRMWQRSGVNQFRQPHNLLGRARQVLAAELPEVWAQIARLGVTLDQRSSAPEPSACIDEDANLQATGIRRTTAERLIAVAADEAARVDVRRGVAVTGLLTGPSLRGGVPHIAGVTTEAHGKITADLVVDACGRRTSVGDWVEDLGCPVERSSESDGFTYFSRWYQHDGDLPQAMAGNFGGVAPGAVCLLFPGDGNVVGVAMAGVGTDRVLRRLNDADRFTSFASVFPLAAPWVDPAVATPITEVMPMGAIQNRHLRLRTDDSAGVTGLINTSDAVASTNPSLGRGIAVAADMAVELRSLLANNPDFTELADRWDRIQQERHLPWLADSVRSDTMMRDAFTAMSEGRAPGPPTHRDRAALQGAASVDMECWRRWANVSNVLAMPNSCLEDAKLMERAYEIAAEAPPPPPPAMSRSDLEARLT